MKIEYLSPISFLNAEDFYNCERDKLEINLPFEDDRYSVTFRIKLLASGYIMAVTKVKLPPRIKHIALSNRILFNLAYGNNIPPEVQREWTQDCLGYFRQGGWPPCETIEDLYKLYCYLVLRCIRGNINIKKFELKRKKTILL